MKHNYENDDNHELAPLLLVLIDDTKHDKQCRHSKRLVALLLVVSATAAAAGVHPIALAFSSVMSTGQKTRVVPLLGGMRGVMA